MSSDAHGNGRVWVVDDEKRKTELTRSPAASYDEALKETGFGLFNIFLLLAAVPIGWTCIIDTTSTAFILNSAECVFELTLFRRGLAVAIIYIGMIVAGPIWDFLLQDYIIGHLGKRNLMILGMLLDAICNILWVHATTFYMFLVLKFISGILIAGPLSVVMAYLTEFHAPTYQPKFARWAGLIIMISNIIPAALAATLMLRAHWFNFTIYNHFYPTWRVYLLICAIPSVLGLWMACLLPESPKFLMAQGKKSEALRLLRTMYGLNNLKSSSEYPITELASQQKVERKINIMCRNKIQDSVSKLNALFSRPNLKIFLIILVLQFASMICFNVMRLWVPPLWVMLNNFRVYIRPFYPADEYITMCEMLFPRMEIIDHTSCNYTLPSVESAVYVNSTIIATSAVSFGFLFTFLTTTKIKKISVMSFTFLLSAIGCFGANWAIAIPYMLVLAAFVIVASRITGNTIMAYNAEVIPQLLRPTAVSMINFTGNLGAAVGNLIFSFIMDIDCLSAFLIIGSLALVCTVLPLFLITRTTKNVKSDIERY